MSSRRETDTPPLPADFPAAPLTLEGYAILHQMFRLARPTWRALDASARNAAVAEASSAFREMERREDGESALFTALGHKGDLMIVHFRRTFDELAAAESAVARLALSECFEPTTSYLSVIEIGLYEATLAGMEG
jgi:hydrogen peroxide-dependent heme synthase